VNADRENGREEIEASRTSDAVDAGPIIG